MNTKHTSIGWRFGLRWVLLTVAGWTIGTPLGFIFLDVVGGILVPRFVGTDSIIFKLGLENATFETFLCAVVGLMQWLALRRVIPRAGFWVPANIIGFTISSVSIHTVVSYAWEFPVNLENPLGALVWTTVFVASGALAGALQQRILRRHVCRSTWWILASAVGWGLGIAAFDMLGLGLAYKISKPLLMFSVLGPVLHGIVTGAVLIWLLRQPTQQTTDAAVL